MALIRLVFCTRDELIEKEERKGISVEKKQIYKRNGQAYNPGS